MASLSILPATLDVVCLKGDEFTQSVTFTATDITGYTFSAAVFATTRTVSSAFPGGIDTQGDTVETMTVTVNDAAIGSTTLSLSETQTANLSESSTYRWFLRGVEPGDVTRTYISGSFAVRSP